MVFRQRLLVGPFRLLVDKPAVKPVNRSNLDQLIHNRVASVFRFGQQPRHFSAVGALGHKHGSDHLHAVFVARIHHVRTGRHDQAFSRRSAPVHQKIHILPIRKSIGVYFV